MKKTLSTRSYSTSTFILPTPTTKPVVATQKADADEASYQAWKKANGLDKPLSRQEYETVFNIY